MVCMPEITVPGSSRQLFLSLAQVAGNGLLSPQQDWYMNWRYRHPRIDTCTELQNDVFDTEMENAFLRMIEKQTSTRKAKTSMTKYRHAWSGLKADLDRARHQLCPLLGHGQQDGVQNTV